MDILCEAMCRHTIWLISIGAPCFQEDSVDLNVLSSRFLYIRSSRIISMNEFEAIVHQLKRAANRAGIPDDQQCMLYYFADQLHKMIKQIQPVSILSADSSFP